MGRIYFTKISVCMLNKPMKIFSTLLAIKEKQIKNTVRYNF